MTSVDTPKHLDRTPNLCEASTMISDHFRLSLIILMSFYSIHTTYPKLSEASQRTFAPCRLFLIAFTNIPIIPLILMFPSCITSLLCGALHSSDLLLVLQNYSEGSLTIPKLYLFIYILYLKPLPLVIKRKESSPISTITVILL